MSEVRIVQAGGTVRFPWMGLRRVRTVSVSMCSVGERMHDERLVVTARRLHVGRRVRRDVSARSHQIHSGSLRLSAQHVRRCANV